MLVSVYRPEFDEVEIWLFETEIEYPDCPVLNGLPVGEFDVERPVVCEFVTDAEKAPDGEIAPPLLIWKLAL